MQSHYFEYLGAKLHYQLGGKERAPVMVLLHGGLGSIDDFAALLPRLQQHFRVVALDTRGHGRSTFGQAALTYAQAADDVRQLLRHLQIQCYSLFGFSDGGITAYRLAATNAEVEKVITVGADWHKDHLAAVRPMFEALDKDFVQANMPEQLAAYQAQNPQADAEKWITNGDLNSEVQHPHLR